ncbi:MAG: aspartate--tRNA ligase [SAR324 cluster bacterium]|nr:aspartate--tRNA ligase [SAR324 cluster bacterium]
MSKKESIQRIYCGKVSQSELTKKIKLYGWVNTRRDHGGVIFIDLRDVTGICQLVFDSNLDKQLHNIANEVRTEFCLEVIGTIRNRTLDTINAKIPTGKFELVVEDITILNKSETLPFGLEAVALASEKTRLTYRYLDLRRPELQKNLILRSKVNQVVRNFLSAHNFHEIETPFLNKSTPEGARDYLVPSRLAKGDFYALPQSPQMFKQLLMVAGFDRYFQITKCFRDEDLRGNRQPEFTQIDLEMSFLNEDEIIDLTEKLMSSIFQAAKGIKLETPFNRITYQQAVENYGTDAPDLRFDLLLTDITDLVKEVEFKVFKDVTLKDTGLVNCILVPNGSDKLSRKDLDELTEFVKIYKAKGLAWAKVGEEDWHSPIAKFIAPNIKQAINKKAKAQPKDILLFVADDVKIVKASLGALRTVLAKKLDLINNDEFNFCWVTDFPLLEYDADEKRWQSVHHPFTKPHLSDLKKYKTADLSKIKSHAYDLTLNGVELGGGSLRIHDKKMQQEIFDIIGISDREANDKFSFLLNALEFGAPPHGGIALGLDRLLMSLTNANSIRDVIAFPKTQQAACLMSGAPNPADQKQIVELGLKFTK